MARQNINLGTAPDGVGGDDVRGAFTKTNANFTELYTEVPQAEAQEGTASTIRGWTARRVLAAIQAWWGRVEKVGNDNGKVLVEGNRTLGESKFVNTHPPLSQGGVTEGLGLYYLGNNEAFIGSSFMTNTPAFAGLHYSYTTKRTHVVMGVNTADEGDKEKFRALLLTDKNTTVASDGTLKVASPIIKLHKDKHEIENEREFGLSPTVTKLSTGAYEIKGTLGLRSDSWFLDTPQDRNGNKYFNVDYEEVVGTKVDGVLDLGELDSKEGYESKVKELQSTTTIIKCFERVWNPNTGVFENGNPVDIKEGRYITLRFNELQYTIKPNEEEVDSENI